MSRRYIVYGVAAAVAVLPTAGCAREAGRWDLFLQDWFWPVLTVTAVVAGLLVAMVVVARVLFRVVPAPRPLSRRLRRTSASSGLVAMAFVAVVATASVAGWPSTVEIHPPGVADVPDRPVGDLREQLWAYLTVGALIAVVGSLVFLTIRYRFPHLWRAQRHGSQEPPPGQAYPGHLTGWDGVMLGAGTIALLAAVQRLSSDGWADAPTMVLISLSLVLMTAFTVRTFSRARSAAGVPWMIIGCCLTYLLLRYRHSPGDARDTSEDLALIYIAATGILLFGLAETSRIRLKIDVWNAAGIEDNAAAAQCVETTRRLGDALPDLENYPGPSNVVGLPIDALLKVSNGVVAVIANAILNEVLRPVTWRAEITVRTAEHATVIVRRLGRVVAEHGVRLSELGWVPSYAARLAPHIRTTTPLTQDDENSVSHSLLIDTSAAALFKTLTEIDRELAPGLCGANSWKSVASHSIAKAFEYDEDAANRRIAMSLVTNAMSHDPGNRLVQFEYIYRSLTDNPTDIEKVGVFASECRREFDSLAHLPNEVGYEALKMRLLYVLAAVHNNLALGYEACPDAKDAAALARSDAKEVLNDLVGVLRKYDHADPGCPRKLCQQVRALKPEIGWLAKSVYREQLPPKLGDVNEWTDVAGPEALRTRYLHACSLASADRNDEALKELTVALADEHLKLWARQEPCFAGTLRREARFKQLIADPGPESFLDLSPVRSHRDALERAGVFNVQDVRRVLNDNAGRAYLVNEQKVPLVLVKQWRGLVDLYNVVENSNEAAPLDIVQLLIDVDIRSIDEIPKDDNQRYQCSQKMEEKAVTRLISAPGAGLLEQWSNEQV